jgi:hypothetical protein
VETPRATEIDRTGNEPRETPVFSVFDYRRTATAIRNGHLLKWIGCVENVRFFSNARTLLFDDDDDDDAPIATYLLEDRSLPKQPEETRGPFRAIGGTKFELREKREKSDNRSCVARVGRRFGWNYYTCAPIFVYTRETMNNIRNIIATVGRRPECFSPIEIRHASA